MRVLAARRSTAISAERIAEFVKCLRSSKSLYDDDFMRQCFAVLDQEGSGVVTRNNFIVSVLSANERRSM